MTSKLCQEFHGQLGHFSHALHQTIRSYYSDFDLIQKVFLPADSPPARSRTKIGSVQLDIKYLYAFVLHVYFILDSAAVLARANFPYKSSQMDALITRKMFPKIFREEADAIILCDGLMVVAILCCTLFGPMMSEKIKMYAFVDKAGSLMRMSQNGRGE